MEMWIRPDGTFSKFKQRIEPLNEADIPDEYGDMPTVEVSKGYLSKLFASNLRLLSKVYCLVFSPKTARLHDSDNFFFSVDIHHLLYMYIDTSFLLLLFNNYNACKYLPIYVISYH